MRIFHSIEHHNQRILPAFNGDYIIQIVILFCRSDRHHSLVRSVSRHAIEFLTWQKTNSNANLAAVFHHVLETEVMALFRHANPLKRPPLRFERLAHGIDAVNEIHCSPVYCLALHVKPWPASYVIGSGPGPAVPRQC